MNFSVGGNGHLQHGLHADGGGHLQCHLRHGDHSYRQLDSRVTVDPTTDTTVEADETAIVTWRQAPCYDVGTPGSATGTITNDDTDVTVAVAPSTVEEDGRRTSSTRSRVMA